MTTFEFTPTGLRRLIPQRPPLARGNVRPPTRPTLARRPLFTPRPTFT